MRIKPVRIPRNIIDRIPAPVTQSVPPPVTTTMPKPVVDVPNPTIEYPVIDLPTREEFEGVIIPPKQEESEPKDPTRDLPPVKPPPQVNLPVVGPVDLPPVGPLITAGATAAVTAVVALGASIFLAQLKEKFLEPLVKKMGKKKNKKIKVKKPVIHYADNGVGCDVFEYSVKGTKYLQRVENVEMYIRDQVEISSLYEYDNKIIIDDSLSEKFTKEGQKRFKKYFVPGKAILKKLSAKFSF